jgi:aldose 1-epimerase
MYSVGRVSVGGRAAWRLSSGAGEEAVVLALGGTVREIALAPGSGLARSILACCPPERIADDQGYAGRILFPFNDRIPGGRYSFAGREHSLKVNSPADGSAIHGFLYRREMECVEERADADSARLFLGSRIEPGDEPGYPFAVSIGIEYALEPGRFSLGFTLRNEGVEPAPVALGWHPYFRLGGRADDWVLEHHGETCVPVGSDLMPLGGGEPVEGGPWDFRSPRRLGPGEIDIAVGGDGPALVLEADPRLFRYIQVYVPPARDSVAVEGVSAATDSFNRPGLGLIVLAGGEERRGAISVRLEP